MVADQNPLVHVTEVAIKIADAAHVKRKRRPAPLCNALLGMVCCQMRPLSWGALGAAGETSCPSQTCQPVFQFCFRAPISAVRVRTIDHCLGLAISKVQLGRGCLGLLDLLPGALGGEQRPRCTVREGMCWSVCMLNCAQDEQKVQQPVDGPTLAAPCTPDRITQNNSECTMVCTSTSSFL